MELPSTPPTTITWSFLGAEMSGPDMERAISIATASMSKSNKDDEQSQGDEKRGSKLYSLNIDSVGLVGILTEGFIRLIRMQREWKSISISCCFGTPELRADLLLACTTHPNVGSLNVYMPPIQIHTTTAPTSHELVHPFIYGIKYNTNLTKLEMRGLCIDVNIANLVARALLRNTTLIDLVLDETEFVCDRPNGRNIAAQTLSFGLRFNRTIESLSFERCSNLEDKDVATLIHAVNSNGTVLRKLSIKHNPCHDEGMDAIAMLLQENRIEDLDMSYLKRKRKSPEEEIQKTRSDNEEGQTEVEEESEVDSNDEGDENKDDANDDRGQSDSEHGDAASEISSTTDIDENDEDDHDSNAHDPSEENTKVDADVEDTRVRKVTNTSLKRLAMASNGMDDDYLESLLGIFAPTDPTTGDQGKSYSQLEELDLIGNRLSKYGVKELLKRLSQFPHMKRLYLGYQYPPESRPALSPALRQVVHPSVLARTEVFTPESLKGELLQAVAYTPENFCMEAIHVMAMTNEGRCLQELLNFYTTLNASGRRILWREGNHSSKIRHTIPLGLWPLVLERANRLHPVRTNHFAKDEDCSDSLREEDIELTKVDLFHAGDTIFYLLHGPMIFDNIQKG